jgi:hypothetical protein
LRHFALISKTNFALAAFTGVLLHSGLVSAVALGNIALQSSLGQPLRVLIPVALNNGESLNASCLKLMRDPAPGTPQLLTGRVNIERNASGTRLLVTTPRPIDEPALRVSVQAGCGNTVRRDYVLLLDPQGIGSHTMIASADPDEFRNYAGNALPFNVAARSQAAVPTPIHSTSAPVPVQVALALVATEPTPIRSGAFVDPAPARTEFKPIDLPPVVVAKVQKEPTPAPVVTTAAPVPAAPREPVMMTAVSTRGAFIPEAAAASLPRVSAENQNPISDSTPSAMLGTHAAASAEGTLWTQTWPYAAVLLSLYAIALTAFVKRRGISAPSWSAPTTSNGRTPTQNTGSANTFAHFAAMTEPAPKNLRPAVFKMEHNDTTYDASLDTLLQEPEQPIDGIDEHVIRRAWADAATESAVDIGSDSILKAIAAAERDWHMAPPEPRQAAIDNALDDDLMPEPKLPPAKR